MRRKSSAVGRRHPFKYRNSSALYWTMTISRTLNGLHPPRGFARAGALIREEAVTFLTFVRIRTVGRLAGRRP
jgi:hypothetical protein